MLIIGLIVGALAKLGWYARGEPTGFIASIIGAILLLAIYRMVIGRRSAGVMR